MDLLYNALHIELQLVCPIYY